MARPDTGGLVAGPFEPATLLADAQRKESLTDWGPGEFERPLGVLCDDYAAAADLNAVGVHILRSGIVHSLRMRLRAQEWIRRHPEILQERILAPIVVVGMMRSGTTLVQRLLAADPRFNAAYGWEVVEVAPRLEYRFGGADPRIEISEMREAKSRELAPDLFAIHPMYAREAEEEIVFLADAFLSHVPESGAHLPRYRCWLDEQDFSPAYTYLHRMLQFLQWQKRQSSTERLGSPKRWVLKSPAHLGYLNALRNQFPDLHIVHMHRDPRATIASGASLNATLHAMHADRVDLARVGAQWLQRMGWTNDRAMAARSAWADQAERVTDIGFDAAVADPIGQIARVYDALGLALTAEAEGAMRRWLKERPREASRPRYALDDYGLRPDQVADRFRLYNKRFEEYVGI